jgi:uncharacterized membrane protein
MRESSSPRRYSRVERIEGRLHEIQEIRDSAGDVLSHRISPLQVELEWRDVVQLIVGALLLGVPVALTEEVWVLGETLAAGRIVAIALTSISTLALFVAVLLFRNGKWREYPLEFATRVTVAYLCTLLIALILLSLIGKGPLNDPTLALKRAVIIALPASFAATAVDSMK